jgi:hypothetical protein
MVNTPVNTPSPAPAPTVALPIIIFSPYEKTLDMNDKDSVKLFKKGSEKLPSKFTGEAKDFASSLTTSPLALQSAIGIRRSSLSL